MVNLLAAAFLAILATPVLAVDTTSGSYIDFAPILNPLIQGVGMFLSVAAVPAAIFAINWLRKRMNLAAIELDAGLQAKLDAGAQKIIGGAISRAQIAPGELGIYAHSAILADAANKLAVEFGDTLTAMGSKDNAVKAVEVVQNRLGLMTAAASGTPVPNPSTDVASVPVAAIAAKNLTKGV